MMYSDVMVDGGARHGGSSCFRAWLERHRWRQDFFPYTRSFSHDMGKTTTNLNEDVSHIEKNNDVPLLCWFSGCNFCIYKCLLETRAVKGKVMEVAQWRSQYVLIPTFFEGGEILLKTCGRRKCAQRRREKKLGQCEVFCRIFVLDIWKLREFPESSQSSPSDSLCREFHSQKRPKEDNSVLNTYVPAGISQRQIYHGQNQIS